MKTCLMIATAVAVLSATSIALPTPAAAGQIWRSGDSLTSDNILSYVFQGRGKAKIFTEADQRREDAARPIVIATPRPQRRTPRTYMTECNTIREAGVVDTQCLSGWR